MGVSSLIVLLKACQISRPFKTKTRCAQINIVQRFIRSKQLVYQIGTHELQKDPRETDAEAKDYIEVTKTKIVGQNRDQNFIINMDQTPVPFTNNPKKTLELIGRQTVHMRKSTNDTKRATFAMTVTASGKVLKPVLVFKGSPSAQIVSREFPTFPEEIVYACPKMHGWMKL
jgi:hypothetical protein